MLTFSVGLNLAGCVINLVLYKIGKNPINLSCAALTGVCALMFYAAGV